MTSPELLSPTSATLADAQYALDLCARIATLTDEPGRITRTFLSPATHRVHALLADELRALGLHPRLDAAGNLRARYPASAQAVPDAPTLLLGSHLDTVPNAGPFDGILGIALPLALLKVLAAEQPPRSLPYTIECIAFSEEEGIRFQLPFIGSRALLGALTSADLARTDAHALTLSQALRDFGLHPESLLSPQSDALLTPNTFAFLELHLEQGPVLESLNLPLAVVDTIVGQSRLQLTFTGLANHAGTTPMHLRRDALPAAAEWLLYVEHFAQTCPGLVATVGSIHAHPGAPNVIPGQVTLSLDLRHPADKSRLSALRNLLAQAERIAATRGLTVTHRETSRQSSVPMNPALGHALTAAIQAAGLPSHTMPSGAGHDAMILASRIPAAMLFLRTPNGLSHHPDESVTLPDVQAALDTLLHLVHHLDPLTFAEPSR